MYTEVNGYNIKYSLVGDKEPVAVVLQGWGTTLEVYQSMVPLLGELGYRVLLLDLPGFGGSTEPGEPWSVDDYGDFFCSFLQHLKISEAMLIGHSYGGRIIIKLAARKELPFTISRIILVDSAGIVPEKTLSQRFRIRKYKIMKKIFGIRLISALFPELVEDWRSRQGSEDYRRSSPVMRACMVKAVNEDLRELMPLIKQEVLLIWGDADTATPPKDARIMESLISGSGLVMIEGAGHYPFLDRPDTFGSVVRAYLSASA